MVFQKYGAVVQINRCFWHGHDCDMFKWPSSRPEFWRIKISETKQRDARNLINLEALGWRILTIWECSLKGKYRLSFESLFDTTSRWLIENTDSQEIRGE